MTKTATDSVATPVSNDLGENSGSGALDTPIPLFSAAYMLLSDLPITTEQYTALGNRLGMTGRGKPYSGYYIKYVMNGKMPVSDDLNKAAEKLMSELTLEPPDTSGLKTVMIKVPNGINVPNGAVVLRDAKACICGAFFIPTIWNQNNHTTACAKMKAKLKRRK